MRTSHLPHGFLFCLLACSLTFHSPGAENHELTAVERGANRRAWQRDDLVCFLDVPTRYYHEGVYGSVGSKIRALAGQSQPFVNYIAMGAPSTVLGGTTNRLIDCTNYISKLAFFGNSNSPGKLIISASAGAYTNNDTYYLDDKHPSPQTLMGGFRDELVASGISSNYFNYLPFNTTNENRFCTNVAGYMSWGSYGWRPAYVWLPSVIFTNDSSWYIMATRESYNGVRGSGSQGNYAEWFLSNAFGGTDYSVPPVGAVCQVDEPYGGTQYGTAYFGLWAKQKNFSICAWNSVGVDPGSRVLLVIGDPLVRR